MTKSELVYADPGSHGSCKNGQVRLDAREIVTANDPDRPGEKIHLVFHRGGYGYKDAGSVKYGHVGIGDLTHVSTERNGINYGDPGFDQGAPGVRGLVHYTDLSWSWINVHGGGVLRALLKEGDDFARCDGVPSIVLNSVNDPASHAALTSIFRPTSGCV